MKLSTSERDHLLNTLSAEQKDFVLHYVKRGKKTIFANIMVQDKGIILPDHAKNEEIELLLDGWILDDYIDNGFVNPETTCECGRPLRYQYIVKHLQTGELRRFGINHFEEHTNIPASLVKKIIQGFYRIDYELDEILLKIKNKWKIETYIPEIPAELGIPSDIKDHLKVDVPLLDRQVKRLSRIIDNYYMYSNDKVDEEIEEDYNGEIIEGYTSSNVGDTDQHHEETIQFSIFDLNEEQPIREDIKIDSMDILPQEYHEIVLSLLKSKVESARVICEILISKHGFSSERYSTGKPILYMPIVRFLEELKDNNIIRLKEKIVQTDRLYHYIFS